MDTELNTSLPSGFDLDAVRWFRFEGNPRFDYPIDYEASVVEADVAAGRIDFLVRWAPSSYCHYHRHLCSTAAAVIAARPMRVRQASSPSE